MDFLTAVDKVECRLVVVPEWTGQEAEAGTVMDSDVIVSGFGVVLPFHAAPPFAWAMMACA